MERGDERLVIGLGRVVAAGKPHLVLGLPVNQSYDQKPGIAHRFGVTEADLPAMPPHGDLPLTSEAFHHNPIHSPINRVRRYSCYRCPTLVPQPGNDTLDPASCRLPSSSALTPCRGA